jgi:hypothetical protein
MPPASVTSDGQVKVTLDEHTLALAREVARETVREHTANCPIIAEFHTMHADMYGINGRKEEGSHPGVMGHVQSLLKSRRTIYKILLFLGSVIVAGVGAIAGKLW